ncbi:MAG: GTPase ObgE [Deltaproteobacteria bacterium]|nr:GTPase ObgE [Deltaproteobacteria bacterium]
MKFIDEADIQVRAGKGGPGARHFRREKYIPAGGPDGGDGGAGGSVIMVADRNRHTLLDFQYHPNSSAEDGEKGGANGRSGKSGEDLIVKVPIGTQVLQHETRELVADLTFDGQEFVIAKGGRGGKGNAFFKSATNQAPDHFQPGEAGEEGRYILTLKLVADVGLVGFPNAGKSTLISRISAARPKIADYPFTTLTPNLGVVKGKGDRTFVVADIPGLIPGAHEGRGLGIKFLKHVERTRIIAHLIDPHQITEDGEAMSPLVSFKAINKELASYSEILAEKPQLVVITKVDTISDPKVVTKLLSTFKKKGLPCLAISSVSGAGIEELIDTLSKAVLNPELLHPKSKKE